MKLMVYSHDAFGLGNIRRMIAICDYLLQSLPQLSILVVSGSPALHRLRLPQGLDYIKLPCIGRDAQGSAGVKFLRTELQETVDLRREILCTTAAHFQPDLVLVDKKPAGLWRELEPTLDYLCRSGQTRLVLLLRDILDSAATTCAQWQREGYYALTEALYDQVWIAGSPDIYPATEAYRFSPTLAAKTRFMGYIRRGPGRQSRAAVRQSLGLSDEPLVLVTCGGGGDGFHLVDTYLRQAAPDRVSLVVGGSEMPAAQKQQLAERIGPQPHLRWLEFTDDLPSYINAADVVVAMGGYNTVCEILSLGKRAVVVPRHQPVAEQLLRVERMGQRGVLRWVHPQQLSPQALTAAVEAQLRERHQPLPAVDLNALPRMAEALRQLMVAPPTQHRPVPHGLRVPLSVASRC